MNQTKLYGEGTYLSTDLGLSIDYAPFARCWHRSELGHSLSTVIVAEVVRGPGVRFGGDECPGGSSADTSLVRVPVRYIVAPDSSLVRPKYVFVYAREPGVSRTGALAEQPWYRRHRFALVLVVYACMLLLLGAMRSRQGRRLLRDWGLIA